MTPSLCFCRRFEGTMITIEAIDAALAHHHPVTLDDRTIVPAAVSCILRSDGAGLQMLFIERSSHEADPWSGNLGFPGGKMEEGDATLQQTAERETREEVGIDLSRARYLGRVSDVGGTRFRVRVACFVYAVERPVELRLSEEVKDAFWISLDALLDPSLHRIVPVRFDDRSFIRPAFTAVPAGKPPLWGLTYRLVTLFLEVLRSEIKDRGL